MRANEKRDVTRVIRLINAALRHGTSPEAATDLAEAKRILGDMDARTGKRDPSKRSTPKK
jgi:hypothetical protein